MVLNILGVILFPLIFLFNSYFIGRLCKRFYPQYSALFLTGLGFFVFLSCIFILTLPIYVLPITLLDYIILVSLLQGLLLILYAANWRYSLSFERVNWSVIVFSLILIFVIIGTWFLSNNLSVKSGLLLNAEPNYPETEENILLSNWNSLVTYLSKPMSLEKYMFEIGTDSISLQYVAWNALNLSWIYIFQIPANTILSPYDGYFTNYSLLVLYAIVTSLVISGIFYNSIQNRNYLRMLSMILIILCINAPLFWITHSPLNGITWIIPISLLLLKLVFDSMVRIYDHKLYYLCAILLISTYTMSSSFIFFNFAIVLVKLLISTLNKEPHIITSFLICSLGLIFPSIFLIQLLSLVASVVFTLIILILYGTWFVLIRYPFFKLRVRQFEGWLQGRIVWFIGFIILLIYGISIFMMFSGGTFKFLSNPWIIMTDPFDQNNLESNADGSASVERLTQVILNISYWTINIVIFMFYFVTVLLSYFPFVSKIKARWISRRNIYKNRLWKIKKLNFSNEVIVQDNVQETNNFYYDSFQMSESETKKNCAVFSLLVFLILWNPLSTNLINRVGWQLNFDLSWLFFLSIVPSLFAYSTFKNKKIEYCFVSLLSLFAVSINALIGVSNFL